MMAIAHVTEHRAQSASREGESSALGYAVTGGGTVIAGAALGEYVTFEGARNTGELGLDVAISHLHTSVLTGLAQGLNVLGGPIVGPLLVLLVTFFLGLRHRRAAMVFATTTLGLWLVAASAKIVFHRVRPPAETVHALVRESAADSFPSGHTALVAALVAGTYFAMRFLGRSGRLALSIGAAAVVLMAASRLYLGVHYLGDVAGSVLFVGGGALLVLAFLERNGYLKDV